MINIEMADTAFFPFFKMIIHLMKIISDTLITR